MFPNSELVRSNIAHHFRKSLPVITEEALIGVLASPRSKWDVYYAVLALRDHGSLRAIPSLRQQLTYPMQDVKDCSLLTIAHIAGAAETPFYVGALEAKGSRKVYPMWAIEVAADERAIPHVVPYITSALKKALRPKSADSGDAYVSGLKYLARIGIDRPECQSLKALLVRAWPHLAVGSRTAIIHALPRTWAAELEGAG